MNPTTKAFIEAHYPPKPSAEAISLATTLSGHTNCHSYYLHDCFGDICDGCLGDAHTIDRELQLPQRNAALLCAQSTVDVYDMMREHKASLPVILNDVLNELRDALAAIKAK